MGNTIYTNAKLYSPGKIIEKGVMQVSADGKIVSVGTDMPASAPEDKVVDLQGRTVIPGLIDVHIHGAMGKDVMDAQYDSLDEISRYNAARGTTSFLATTMTEGDEAICRALEVAGAAVEQGVSGADLVGIHLEGPFIHEKRRGAQAKEHIRLPKQDEMEKYFRLSGEHIRLVTLAPEVEGGIDAVKWFVEHGVTVSMGHSDATFAEAAEAVKAGANHTTHHFNGMSPLHHREPGLAGAGMILPEITTELVADGYHVHPEVVKLLFQVKGPEGICLITDAVHVAGLPDGDYGDVYMEDGRVMLGDGSSLAGSTLSTLQGLKNVIEFTGLPLEQVLISFTQVPARQVKIADRKGSLEPGKDADFLVLDDELNLLQTVVKGRIVYQA